MLLSEWSTGRKFGEDAAMEKIDEDLQALIPSGACGAFVSGLEDEYLGSRNKKPKKLPIFLPVFTTWISKCRIILFFGKESCYCLWHMKTNYCSVFCLKLTFPTIHMCKSTWPLGGGYNVLGRGGDHIKSYASNIVFLYNSIWNLIKWGGGRSNSILDLIFYLNLKKHN